MRYSIIIPTIVVILGCWFNIPKISTILQSYITGDPYGIFPWSFNQTRSNSNPIWLFVHVLSALAMIILALDILVEKRRINNGTSYDRISRWFSYSHYAFTALILSNIINFGQSTVGVAILANGAPLLIANIAYFQIGKWEHAKWLYFFAITSPIVFEVFMFLREYVPIILFVFFSYY
jgi:hypothetical protein